MTEFTRERNHEYLEWPQPDWNYRHLDGMGEDHIISRSLRIDGLRFIDETKSAPKDEFANDISIPMSQLAWDKCEPLGKRLHMKPFAHIDNFI